MIFLRTLISIMRVHMRGAMHWPWHPPTPTSVDDDDDDDWLIISCDDSLKDQ